MEKDLELYSKEELMQLNCKLQQEITGFSKVRQKLIHSKDQLDLELNRYQVITNFNKTALQTNYIHEIASLALEAIIEAFEFQFSIFLTYDKDCNLIVNETFDVSENIPDVFEVDRNWNITQGTFLIKENHPIALTWKELEIAEAILGPIYDSENKMVGFIISGITHEGKDHFESVTSEYIPAYEIILNQIGAVWGIFRINQTLENKVKKRTQQLNLQKQEIEKQHHLLTKQHENLILEQSKNQNMLLKIETLFGQHASKEVAQELVKSDGEFEGKAYEVTIMFLDIRDFTVFADSKTPQELASFQNIVFSELINIVRAHHGIINQILGDGIMATFGAPVPSKNHIENAVSAGYEIIRKIKKLGDNKKIPIIRIGIGLHSGKVVAGNIGNQFRKQYSLTGTTVIIASRIEQLNKTFKSQFLVSDAIYKTIKDNNNQITFLGKQQLKGIETPVGIYQLV